jgi:hypothetical protein
MAKFDWKKMVGAVAPTLATALGGPLAGMAVKTIATQLLGKDNATEEEVEAAILGASPQDMIRLKEIDFEFKKTMVDAGIKLEEIAAADRNSARDREIKTGDVWTPRILAALIMLGYFGIQWYIVTHLIPQEMREIVMRSLGTLDMALGMMLGYYFGSSASGKTKDETIATIAKME